MITNNNKKEDLNATNSNILFETSDFDRSTELLLFEQDDGKRFQLHLWNADTDQAMVIELTKADLRGLIGEVYSLVVDDGNPL